MDWVRSHPYATACGAAGFAIMIGAFVVERGMLASPRDGISLWGGSGTPLINPTSYDTLGNVIDSQPQLGSSGAQPVYIPPTQHISDETGAPADTFDFGAFIASLTQPTGSAASSSTSINAAYSFIPRGLIATSTPAKTLTKQQQALYEYGNEVGSYVQTYEDSHRNAPIQLRDQIEDRQNKEKGDRVRSIAAAMRQTGQSLLTVETLPQGIAAMHTALANAYIDTGTKLANVPDAQSDQQLLAAITAYNAAADGFANAYVSLATLFSTAGVVFSSQDPGSVFTFTSGGSL